MSEIKLKIEMIPQSTWGINCRSLLSFEQWSFIRARIIKDSNKHCGICNIETIYLECHEVWKYSIRKRQQILIDLIAICKMCHLSKHIGRTKKVEPELYDNVIEHIKRVNKFNNIQWETYFNDIVNEHENICRKTFSVNIDLVNSYLPLYLTYKSNLY